MKGGKNYGKGSKGYLIDVFGKDSDDNEYFINGTCKLINNIDSIVIDIKQSHELFNDSMLIKCFNKEENFKEEFEKSLDLINYSLIDDYIIFKDNKYNAIYDITTKKYGLIKLKCENSIHKYHINNNFLHTNSNSISLQEFVSSVLLQIINLQRHNYNHCDIKADNIMVCGGNVKLIDWDLAQKTQNYELEEICGKRYYGSSTHTSPLIENLLSTCNKRSIQKLKRVISGTFSFRNVSLSSNMINLYTKSYLLLNSPESLKSLIKYHIDLYSFSIVLHQLDIKKLKNLELICEILQNTIYVSDNNEFKYIIYDESIPETDVYKTIEFQQLLDLIPLNYCLEL